MKKGERSDAKLERLLKSKRMPDCKNCQGPPFNTKLVTGLNREITKIKIRTNLKRKMKMKMMKSYD
mgnify:CR=1 FL=1